MSVLELTKNAPKDEESSERSGIFSSLFSGNSMAETKCELALLGSEGERIDRLAKVAESALNRHESSMWERHIFAGALISDVMSSKAFNWWLVGAVKEMLAGNAEERREAKSKTDVRLVNCYINIALLVVALFLVGLNILEKPVGFVVAIVLIYIALLNNSKKINLSRVIGYLVISVTHGSCIVPILASSVWTINEIGILALVLLSAVFWLGLVLPLRGVGAIEDSVMAVTKRESRQCLIDKGISDYALSVIKRCFDAGVISDSSFSAEAEDTARGDEVYKRVPERVRVSALLAVLHGDKESISLRAVERGVGV